MRKYVTWLILGLAGALVLVAALHGAGHPVVADVTDPGVW